jgi:hypothetical protein
MMKTTDNDPRHQAELVMCKLREAECLLIILSAANTEMSDLLHGARMYLWKAMDEVAQLPMS